MAQLNTYYLDGTTLLTSTSVFQDAALTTVSADGWYSDSTTIDNLSMYSRPVYLALAVMLRVAPVYLLAEAMGCFS